MIFFSHYRKRDNSGYHLRLSRPLEGYPSGDDEKDARQITAVIEEAILAQPDQYLWLHERFKSRVPGAGKTPYDQTG